MKDTKPVGQKDVRRAITGALGAAVCLVFSLIFAATSFAWFSSNKKVDQSGLTLGTDPTANLVISDDAEAITDAGYTVFSVDFSDGGEDPARYAPCTHDGGYGTGLKYVTSSANVNFITGLVNDAERGLTFAEAENGSVTRYYAEHTAYIASVGRAMENVTLSGNISSVKKGETEVSSGSFLATSVDFYLVGEDDSLTYLGTVNAATREAVTLFDGTVPHNTEGYLTILTRAYFDGALTPEDDDTRAYINSASVNAGSVSLDIVFTATDN